MRHLPLLALLLVLTSCEGLSPTEPFSTTSTLSGVVKDPYGSVWGGVTVGLVADQGVAASGHTNDGGRYSLKSLRPGHYRVWLQLGRTGPGEFVGEIELREGNNTFDIQTR